MSLNSPYLRKPTSVTRVMAEVLLALIPAVAVYAWFFGVGILVQIALATVAAIAFEAGFLKLRGRPIGRSLADLSAVVTAWLIALAFPSIGPWWLVVAGTAFAIVVAKHLYGGLGQNPFNPAMVAYAVMIVAFPALMSQWPGAGRLDASAQLDLIFGGARAVDAITAATPLDALRTGLRAEGSSVNALLQGEGFGLFAGHGWEWIAFAFLIGGLYLLARRIITWHIPVAYLGSLAALATIASIAAPQSYPGPVFSLFSGAAMLGAFFILTDPVSGATTPRGKLIYAAGAALITWIIRHFGAFPDGVAFATLLMNLCVPLIDMKTQPPVFGHKTKN
ncbi:RnfABCDGE type electron transport complex subunit D [Niveibacterium microcysteis]|uniref:Ion-translocating oxidoreductase complex subunit D n=1 Tax=Niveibacterium microcysteis TaxID=2811415 RepID=A0ABX7M0N7_9RHOO|nr:RnfABCDGE type electron transport complex subunit D [Niveibacterium microcysteis]QSI75324.1 RnfABCDGE type electron transport complex subunit D [Niveibacterium microcysteis]